MTLDVSTLPQSPDAAAGSLAYVRRGARVGGRQSAQAGFALLHALVWLMLTGLVVGALALHAFNSRNMADASGKLIQAEVLSLAALELARTDLRAAVAGYTRWEAIHVRTLDMNGATVMSYLNLEEGLANPKLHSATQMATALSVAGVDSALALRLAQDLAEQARRGIWRIEDFIRPRWIPEPDWGCALNGLTVQGTAPPDPNRGRASTGWSPVSGDITQTLIGRAVRIDVSIILPGSNDDRPAFRYRHIVRLTGQPALPVLLLATARVTTADCPVATVSRE